MLCLNSIRLPINRGSLSFQGVQEPEYSPKSRLAPTITWMTMVITKIRKIIKINCSMNSRRRTYCSRLTLRSITRGLIMPTIHTMLHKQEEVASTLERRHIIFIVRISEATMVGRVCVLTKQETRGLVILTVSSLSC